jgi:hypothetical protein
LSVILTASPLQRIAIPLANRYSAGNVRTAIIVEPNTGFLRATVLLFLWQSSAIIG